MCNLIYSVHDDTTKSWTTEMLTDVCETQKDTCVY